MHSNQPKDHPVEECYRVVEGGCCCHIHIDQIALVADMFAEVRVEAVLGEVEAECILEA